MRLYVFPLLKDLRIIEAASFVAGPSCGLHLVQLGAEVIRLDQIGGGPDFHRWPLAPGGGSLYWDGLNKGKKSVSIDLTRPEGRDLAVALATARGNNAGLFITNFPLKSFLSYERLSSERNDFICLRIMGWSDGTQAVDYTINCAVGLPYLTGHPDDERPVNHVLPAWDLLAGAYGAFALLAAERERRISGSGRHVQLALSDLAAATLGNLGQVAEVLIRGRDRLRCGNDIFGAFGRDFLTRDGERVMVVAITPRQWKALVAACRLDTAIASLETELCVSFENDEGVRFVHRDRLVPLFSAAIQARDLNQLSACFEAHGVCWSRYQSLQEAVSGDSRLFSGDSIFSSVAYADGMAYPTPGAAVRLQGEERAAARRAPLLGENTDEVLASVLQLSSAEIGRLHDQAIVAGPGRRHGS